MNCCENCGKKLFEKTTSSTPRFCSVGCESEYYTEEENVVLDDLDVECEIGGSYIDWDTYPY